MKKLVFGLIATVMFGLAGHAQKVGEIKDGKFVVTEDLTFLIEKWDNLLKEDKIDGQVGRFEITSETYKDEKTEKEVEYYQITGYSKDGSVKVATELTARDSALSLSIADSSTCVCNGCTLGCHPAKLRGIAWYCDNPCSECSKSETAH